MFLVEREESRGFDMFSSVRFLCLEEEKSSEFVQAESREPGSFFFFFFFGPEGA